MKYRWSWKSEMMKNSRFLSYFYQYAMIVAGSAIYASAFEFFLYQNAISTGGVTGISMIINYLTTFPVGIMTIIINIPLFIVALKEFGIAYTLSSLIGMLLSSVMVDLLSLLPVRITSEVLLAAVYGGLFEGLGLGLVFRAGASTGGVDIAAKLLRRKYAYINYGTLTLMLNTVIVAAFAIIFRKFDSAMYAIIAMFISARVIDLVLYGASASKLCYIITDASAEIKTSITEKLHRGVTFLHGEGAFSGRKKDVILCVIKKQQIVELRKIVGDTDTNAFIIISDAKEVFGQGFGNITDSR